MKKWLLFIAIALVLTLAACDNKGSEMAGDSFQEVEVSWIIDGDTFRTKDDKKIRVIGINTPEVNKEKIEPYGREAQKFAIDLLKNKKVYLEKDVSDKDQYGRLLRHVWLKRPEKIDGESLEKYCYGAIVLKEGYGQVYTFAPDVKYEKYYLDISRKARDNRIGLWGENIDGTTRGSSLD